MDWNSLAQFSAATLLVLLTPGPIMAIIAHNTLRHGVLSGFSTVIGVEFGEVCLLGAMLAGLSLSGDLTPLLFRWLSFTGALYLIWLAADAMLVRHRSSPRPNPPRARSPLLGGLMIAFASPAALLFYAAFFPQFMDPDRSISMQIALLGVTYVGLRTVSASACILTVARLRLSVDDVQLGRIANLGTAAIYLSIAVITMIRLMKA